MSMNLQLPENVKRLAPGEKFSFSCHPGVECFTNCCHDLELSLTPYDVLRLKNELKLSSTHFLDQYVLVEKEENEVFPRCYLTMVDDGMASCPFVTDSGCKVYDSRPGACRVYPLGRAVSQACGGRKFEFHVLLTEPHCLGFNRSRSFTAEEWTHHQGLTPYNELNDEVMTLLQHKKVKQGIKLTKEQTDMFVLALYNLDEFRNLVLDPGFLPRTALSPDNWQTFAADDTSLLRFGIRWLKNELFGEANETCPNKCP